MHARVVVVRVVVNGRVVAHVEQVFGAFFRRGEGGRPFGLSPRRLPEGVFGVKVDEGVELILTYGRGGATGQDAQSTSGSRPRGLGGGGAGVCPIYGAGWVRGYRITRKGGEGPFVGEGDALTNSCYFSRH